MAKKKRVVEVNSINPVDFYNRNYVEQTIEKLVLLKCVHRTGMRSLTYVKNKPDENKRMIVIDEVTGMFEAELDNGFNMAIGEKYTPFMMLQKYIYKGNFREAMAYVTYQLMNNEDKYVRIGTKYFKRIKKKDRYKVNRENLKPWERVTLVDDYGRDFLNNIKKYQDFTMEPNNKEYTRDIDGCYNSYKEFDHKPCSKEDYKGRDSWKWIETLMRHIFGNEDIDFDKGIKYLKVLYDHPMQALPILVLISQERQTGKTTFVNFMTLLFGANCVTINPQDIGNSFNGAYAEKNIIMIEESHFDSRQALEKIKNLSTQKEILVNSKFIPQYSIPFFGKIIITSNDENKFSKVDDEEIRYWVRKIPTLKGKANHRILEDLRDEIPAFLYYLNSLEDIDTSISRMVLTEDEIKTDALTAVKLESRESVHKDIELYLESHCINNPSVKVFYFTGLNIKDKFFSHNQRFGAAYINRVLKVNMKLDKSEKTMRFTPLEVGGLMGDKFVGKPYIYPNKYYSEDGSGNEPDVPF